MKSLQTAESTIETLNQQLAEMGASDSLSRARVEHERVLAGVQQRHDKEVKVLKEKIENLTDKLNEVVGSVWIVRLSALKMICYLHCTLHRQLQLRHTWRAPPCLKFFKGLILKILTAEHG